MARVERLRWLCAQLKHEIREEGRRPFPDTLRIQQLKRRKLAAKDELAMLEAGLVPVRV